MKRIILTSLVLVAFATLLSAQSSKQILQDALREGVEAKVTLLQEQIKFTDEQAEQIKEIEIEFLTGVQKAEKCFMCSKKKRVENLAKQRDDKLQSIMTRGQYIRYFGGSIDDVKNHPVMVD